jgi:uncharacterized protein (TIGR03084 family)
MQQAKDFLEESRVLYALLEHASDQQLSMTTQFKAWTIEDVVGHLHFWNLAALSSLTDPEGFQALFEPLGEHLMAGGALKSYEREYLRDCRGVELLSAWRAGFERTADAFSAADPAQRVAWAGPSMSARSSISARQMETWAHGQEVFDILGAEREETDRIRNIVVLGVNTYSWTFAVRGETPPEPQPEVRLVSPTGELWQFGEPQSDNAVIGGAVEFAQVVTQTRNVADTSLKVMGGPAEQWMAKAQCFAGAANTPPAPGSRYRV